jgi:hypothetical protein
LSEYTCNESHNVHLVIAVMVAAMGRMPRHTNILYILINTTILKKKNSIKKQPQSDEEDGGG